MGNTNAPNFCFYEASAKTQDVFEFKKNFLNKCESFSSVLQIYGWELRIREDRITD